MSLFAKGEHMKNKIAITTESAADLDEELLKAQDLSVFPMTIIIGDEEYLDGESISTEELYKKAELYNALPKTTGVSPYEYGKVFSDLCDKGFDVVHVALSSKISSCFQNAMFASKSFENVFVVDSLTLSGGMAALVSEAISQRESGKNVEEIACALEIKKKKISTSFILDNVDYIYAGGRCTSVQKKAAELFSAKPSINLKNGELALSKLFFGKSEDTRKKYILHKLNNEKPIYSSPCRLNYSTLEKDEAEKLCTFIKENSPFGTVIATQAGCCISSHCGKGCAGIIFECS